MKNVYPYLKEEVNSTLYKAKIGAIALPTLEEIINSKREIE